MSVPDWGIDVLNAKNQRRLATWRTVSPLIVADDRGRLHQDSLHGRKQGWLSKCHAIDLPAFYSGKFFSICVRCPQVGQSTSRWTSMST